MTRFIRICAVVVLAGIVASGNGMALDPALDAQMRQAVQRALGDSNPTADDALLARIASAHALTSVSWLEEDGMGWLTYHVSGLAQLKVLSLDEGRKLVVELPQVINIADPGTVSPAAGSVLTAARASQFSVQPSFASRVVLQLSTPCGHERIQTDEGVSLVVRPVSGKERPVTISFVKTAVPARAEDSVIEPSATIVPDTLADNIANVAQPTEPDLILASHLTTPLPGEGTPRDELSALVAELKKVAETDVVYYQGVDTRDAAPEDGDVGAVRAQEGGAVRSTEETTSPAENEVAIEEGTDASEEPDADVEVDIAPSDAEEESETPVPVVVEAETEAGEGEGEGEGESEEQPEPPAARAEAPADSVEATTSIVKSMQEYLKTQEAEQETVVSTEVVASPPSASALQQPVNLDFRETELSQVVAILAAKGGINVIAGADLTGTVTANLQGVPLMQAMQTVLRMNGLGILEEEGIYYIVPYEESIQAKRRTVMVDLESASSDEVREVLEDIIKGSLDEDYISISSNPSSNVIIIAGPEGRIERLVDLTRQLDVAPPQLPTITEAIKLNYADPIEMQELIQRILRQTGSQGGDRTGGSGTGGGSTVRVAADTRAHHIIITDVPIVVEQVRELVRQLDVPVKQVSIDAMIVDVTLRDAAETGVDWLLSAVRRQSRRQAVLPDGRFVGNLQELGLDTNLGLGPTSAGILSFEILSGDIDWRGLIQAEVRDDNSRLISNPNVVALENTAARLTISQEIPYVELVETAAGGSQTNTEFKDIGTVLEVTPRVTHDNHIFVDISSKESDTTGEFNGIPIEDKREIDTSALMKSGQTIFIGGLRKNNNDASVRKIPVLGDLPVLNVLFRQNIRDEGVNELLIFLTCTVVDQDAPLRDYAEQRLRESQSKPLTTDPEGALFRDMIYPGEESPPIWKFRRSD